MATTDDSDRDRFLAPTEVARQLGMSKSSVYRAISAGSLPAVQLRPHGALRVPTDALEARGKRK